MAELLNSSSLEGEIKNEVRKILKSQIEPPMNNVNKKFIVFKEQILSQMQDDLTYGMSLEENLIKNAKY